MLISTKVDIPPLKERMLRRANLLAKLVKSSGARLVLISGEAASGKTSLACQWIHEEGLDAAWYTLDADDNDPDLFLRYLLTSLAKIDPGLRPVLTPWIKSQKHFSIKEVAPFLIQHYQGVRKDLYIVLDDYHLIVDEAVHEAVSLLLKHLPPHLHLVILTRHDVPFSVSFLRVREQMVEITAREMKLTEQETGLFFTDIVPCNLSDEQREEVFRQTEGWIGGLQLFTLSFKGNGVRSHGKKGVHPYSAWMKDYLIEEVLNAQEEKIRKFLYMTCPLDRFNVEVCKEVTGGDDAGALLDHVYRNNLFLLALDTEGEWYRYHPLLSDAVRRRFQIDSPEAVANVHRKAGLWFSRNGYAEDALRHAFATNDVEFAADMLEDRSLLFLDLSAQRWLNRLPEAVRMERPILGLFVCNDYLQSMQVSKAEQILNDIERRKDQLFSRYGVAKQSYCEDLLVLEQCLLVYYRNPLTVDVHQLEKKYDALWPRNRNLAALIKIAIAASHVFQGELRKAFDTLQGLSGAFDMSESPYGAIIWFSLLASVEIQRGRLSQAEALLDAASESLEQEGLSYSPLRFLTDLPRAWLCYYRNDLNRASELLANVLSCMQAVDVRAHVLDAGFLSSLIHLANGRFEEAAGVVKKMRLTAPPESEWLRVFDALSLALSLIAGEGEGRMQWLAQKQSLRDASFSLLGCVERTIYADIYRVLGQPEEAAAMLGVLRERCVQEHMLLHMLIVDIKLGAIYWARGERERAKATLEKALVFADKENCLQPFLSEVSLIAPVLQEIANDPPLGLSTAFLQAILAACGIAGDGARQINMRQGRLNRLTDRELEILRFMVQGYKNREIAEKAFVSLDTVKTHLKHIYGKLRVETRVQAMLRTEELKIFGHQQDQVNVASSGLGDSLPLLR